MIFIAVLVAVCVVLVWRRDGVDGVLEILIGDLALFGGSPGAVIYLSQSAAARFR